MILYNVTISIDKGIEKEWLQWMKSIHILDVLNTGMFKTAKVFRLLNVEDEGATYSIQYFADTMNHVLEYQEKYAAGLQQEHTARYKDKFVAFRSLLEEA